MTKANLSLTNEVKEEALRIGASIVGIADLVILKEKGFPFPIIHKYTRAISIGVHLSDNVIDELIDEPTLEYAQHYTEINNELDRIASQLENYLHKKGFEAQSIPASKRYDKEKLTAVFPHKTAAILSGIGWIGKSALLISFDYGPRIRLATILTNAPLLADNPQMKSNCGKCTECVDICPVDCISGELWEFGDSREKLFDAYKCSDQTSLQKKRVGQTICGLCIRVCPFGQ